MPTMTRHRRTDACYYGRCGRRAQARLHFDLDLRDGKKPIKVFACTEEHLRHLRTILLGSAEGERHA